MAPLTAGKLKMVLTPPYRSSFNAVALADAVNISASVTASIGGNKVASLQVIPIVDHPVLNQRMPGYIDVPFEFTVDDNLQGATATIQFTIKSDFQRDEDFVPAIYYYNESTQELEELDTTIDGNVASAVVTHFSTYILLDKTAFDKVWETEIKPPIDSGDGSSASIDVVFVIDASGRKLLTELVWKGLELIPYMPIVKAALDLTDFVFNMGDVAEQCACLYAISKSATILAKDFRSTISNGDKVENWTIIYDDYASAADDYFALTIMRATSENQMTEANKANSFLIEWLFTKIMYKVSEIEDNLDKLEDLKYKYVIPGGC